MRRDHGRSELALERLDRGRVDRRQTHLGELWQNAAQGIRDPGVERGVQAAANGDLAEQARRRQARIVKVLDQSARSIAVREHFPECRQDQFHCDIPARDARQGAGAAVQPDLMERNDAARSQEARGGAQELDWVGLMNQHVSPDGAVEPVVVGESVDRRRLEGDMRDLGFACPLARHRQDFGAAVDPDDGSRRADQLGGQQRDIAGAAA